MSNKWLTTLYVGVTNDFERRVLEHKANKGSNFTRKYKLNRLIYYEEGASIEDAIAREKQLKKWHSDWKWNLIKSMYPELKDLSDGWYDDKLLKGLDPEINSG